jgi:hypothetical protein
MTPQQRTRVGLANINNLTTRINRSTYEARQLAVLTSEDEDLARARLYHQHISGIKTRKYNAAEYQYEHDIWVTETCIRLYRALTDRAPPTDYVVSWLLHDAVEDRDVSLRDIAINCNSNVARLVAGVTLPDTEEMRRLYPHISPDRLNLKNHYKTEMLSSFVISQCLLKIADGLSACRSFASDINHNRIMLTDDETQVSGDAALPRILSRAWMTRNMQGRQAYTARLHHKCLSLNNDRLRNPDGIDTKLLVAFSEILHQHALTDWRDAIAHAGSAPTRPSAAAKAINTCDFPAKM